MEKVMVTGNEGYVGSILTEKLIDKGYFVIGLDLGIFKDVNFLPTNKKKASIQIYKDIRDIEQGDLKDIKTIIHLAGISNDPTGDLNPNATYEINHKASVRLAKLAKSTGVRKFLFSSSCSIYGASDEEFTNEENQVQPLTPYAWSKIKTEEDVRRLANKNFTPTFLRNSTVFGTSPKMRLDLVVQNLLAYAYLSKTITIMSNGLLWRPLIHIQDIAEAFMFLMEAPIEKVHNQTFNIGDKKNNLQIIKIAEMIKLIIPDAKIEIRNLSPKDARSYKIDFSKINSIGYKTKYTVMDGIKEMREVFKNKKITAKDFESEQYLTIKMYKKMIESGEMDENLRLIKK